MKLFEKITSKNTWNINTIDTFTTTEVPLSQTANILSACAQIYSTRVDDLSDKTNKLLENFNFNIVDKKKTKKRNVNIGNTNKEFKNEFIAPKNWQPRFVDGYLSIKGNCGITELPFYDVYVDLENKILCPGISKIKIDTERKMKGLNEEIGNNFNNKINLDENNDVINVENNIEHNEYVDVNVDMFVNENVIEHNDLNLNENIDNVIYDDQKNASFEIDLEPILKKGWSGPNYWKIDTKKSKRKNEATKINFIDFNVQIKKDIILEKGDNNLNPTIIKERKKCFYFLPNDYEIKSEMLYKYIYLDGSFKKLKKEKKVDENIDLNISAINNNSFNDVQNENMIQNNNLSISENPEIITDFANVQSNELSRNLFKKCAKIQKRVDIKKLKDDIYKNIEDENTMNIVDVCDKLVGEDVSIHYCIVSLLHLANEKNVLIEENGSEVKIKK